MTISQMHHDVAAEIAAVGGDFGLSTQTLAELLAAALGTTGKRRSAHTDAELITTYGLTAEAFRTIIYTGATALREASERDPDAYIAVRPRPRSIHATGPEWDRDAKVFAAAEVDEITNAIQQGYVMVPLYGKRELLGLVIPAEGGGVTLGLMIDNPATEV